MLLLVSPIFSVVFKAQIKYDIISLIIRSQLAQIRAVERATMKWYAFVAVIFHI